MLHYMRNAKRKRSTFSTIFLISYVIWRHKFKARIFKVTVWYIHFSMLSHVIIYLGFITCGCINQCSHLPVSIARKGKIFQCSWMLVWLREEKGLSESYLVCILLPISVFFLIFGKRSYFQESSYIKNATHKVPICFTDQGPASNQAFSKGAFCRFFSRRRKRRGKP